MDAILLQILNGLDKGGAYALIALGLTLIFGTWGSSTLLTARCSCWVPSAPYGSSVGIVKNLVKFAVADVRRPISHAPIAIGIICHSIYNGSCTILDAHNRS